MAEDKTTEKVPSKKDKEFIERRAPMDVPGPDATKKRPSQVIDTQPPPAPNPDKEK